MEVPPSAVGSLLRPEVAGLPAYDPGADPDEVARMTAVTRVVKLSNNENPYGMSPAAVDAVRRRLEEGLGRYPDPAGKALCAALARHHGIEAERIILGNGSENIVELLCQAFVGEGDGVVTQAPCFGLHEIFPLMMGARLCKVPLTPAFDFDTDAWRTALRGDVKLVLLAHPSNPTGIALSHRELEAVIAATPGDCLLVIDEAYFEYAKGDVAYPDALEHLRGRTRPWIVLRTFSKAYGLASLRVGYGIASHRDVTDALHRVRTPYNVNQLAQEAALAALGDTAHLERSVHLIHHERARMTAALRALGLRVAPSLTNFLFVDTGGAAAVMAAALRGKGIIVKDWRETGYRDFIRVSLSLPEENDLFLRAITHLVSNPTGSRSGTPPIAS